MPGFIGRYENYQEDVIRMFDEMGAQLEQIPQFNQASPHSYVDAYNETSRKLVEQMCYKDIETFKYSFGS